MSEKKSEGPDYQKRRHDRLKAEGRCASCGKIKKGRDKAFVKCAPCRAVANVPNKKPPQQIKAIDSLYKIPAGPDPDPEPASAWGIRASQS